MKIKRMLIFISGPVPSESDLKLASEYKAEYSVGFRNVNHFDPERPLEQCDLIGGLVPDKYKKADCKLAKNKGWGKKE